MIRERSAARRARKDFGLDPRYVQPGAWTKVKQALGRQYGFSALFHEWGKLARRQGNDGCPRFLLAAAVHAFLSSTEDERRAKLRSYVEWSSRYGNTPAAESCAPSELALLDTDFHSVVKQMD